MVLSCANPCIQGISNPKDAEAAAIRVNYILAADISNNSARFGAFAALSMHNATVAAQELRRAVTELGFLGALVNDYQQSGTDNSASSTCSHRTRLIRFLVDTLLFYDQPEYDEFWEAVTELDVPVYFHPRENVETIDTMLYSHAIWLSGPSQGYAATLSTHILGLCTNGVFE